MHRQMAFRPQSEGIRRRAYDIAYVSITAAIETFDREDHGRQLLGLRNLVTTLQHACEDAITDFAMKARDRPRGDAV